jgi:hypothetical protein
MRGRNTYLTAGITQRRHFTPLIYSVERMRGPEASGHSIYKQGALLCGVRVCSFAYFCLSRPLD